MQRKRCCCSLSLTETFDLLTVITVVMDGVLALFFLSLIVILIMGWCGRLDKIDVSNWMNPKAAEAGLTSHQFF